MTTAYGYLSLHHSRYIYKRGQYKGDAPALKYHRGKSHFRVIKPDPAYPNDPYKVLFWQTNILLAYPDGRIKINANGFDTRSTTRSAMQDALSLCGFRGSLYSMRLGTLSQTAVRINGKSYRYYDVMEFDAAGTLLTPPMSWQAGVMDTDQTKAFRAQTKEFWGMYPVLFAARNTDRAFLEGIYALLHKHGRHLGMPNASIFDDPENWPVVVGYYTKDFADDDAKQARAHLMRMFTQNMTKLVDRGME